MQERSRLFLVALLATLTAHAADSQPATGSVSGTVVEPATNHAVEYVAVALQDNADAKAVRNVVTDAKGKFLFEGVPFGEYELGYGIVGGEVHRSLPFKVDAQHRALDLGQLTLADPSLRMDKVEVSARKEAFYNSIDRKVYNVGKDIQSVTGSASDLLQNVPSVQVDIEGNVSLRGDANVLILVNGKTSTMMGKNRAAVLEQMPADGIEKIEVITNPSAKYKPDGTAGIINLTLKKKQEPGYSGSVRVAAGNDRRYNVNVTANVNPGKYNLFATAGVRQDDRPRFVQDDRSHVDAATNSLVSTSQHTTENSRPLSRIVQAGVDYKLDDQTKIGGSVHYNYRDFFRTSTVTNLTRGATGAVTGDYDRFRTDPEYEKDLEFTGTLQHSFAKEDHDLNLEIRHGRTTEQEDNHYTNVYRTPALAKSFDNTLIKNTETNTEATADYTRAIDDESKFEAGYDGQDNKIDMDFHGSFLDPATNTLVVDTTKTNRFIYDSTVHAFYSTYAHKLGEFGFLAGLRFEHTGTDTDQVTAHLRDKNDYNRFYPSLHTSYNLSDTQQLQANYSHRVHRPEGDDLNPYPEYQDPFNLRAGNPHLVPEDIHSVETGWQYKNHETTYLATAYYRYRYHGMTDVTRYINSTTLLTTKENLGSSHSSGLELGATTRLKDSLSLNFSANAYRNEIDASNLGFSTKQSAFAWDAKLNANWDLTKTTLIQLNTNFTAKRLTPQGYRYPTSIANIGLRHRFADKKTSLILSVSDVFNSLRERTHIDTPVLHEEITRHRSSRIVYLGVIYNFGKPPKKNKDDLQFDDKL